MMSTKRDIGRRILTVLTVLLVLSCTAGLVLAAEGHGGGEGGTSTPIPVNDVIEAIVNFALFVALLVWLGRGPMRRFFEARSQAIAADLDRAARLRREAEARLDECTACLETLQQDRQRIIDMYRDEAEAEKRQIIETARREAERIRSDTKAIVRYETERARQEIRQRIVEQAIDKARQAIERDMSKKMDRRLVDEFTEALSEIQNREEERIS